MKKLGKALLSVSAACVLACAAGAIAACGDGITAAHTHDWSGWTEKTAADCTHAKIEERNCLDENCTGGGHEERTVGQPLNHDMTEWAEETPADCTHAQILERHCKRTGCTEKDTKDGDAALNHDWQWTTESEATCTAGKHETATCGRAGCTATNEKTGEPDTLNHDFTEWAEETPADCMHAQILERHCQRAGCTEKDTKDGTAALEHDWRWTTESEATCGAKGSKSGVCTVCGDNVNESIPATGNHTPTGAYCACAVCGTQPQEFDLSVNGNTPTIDFTVKAGEWCTVRHMFFSPGYVVYTYKGAKPVQIWYSTYGNGTLSQGNATLNNGDTFYMPSSSRGTGYMALKTNSDEDVTGTITGNFQQNAPVMPTALTLGTQTVTASADGDNPNTFYEFIATEEGENNYVLYCEDTEALILKKDGSDSEYVQATLPYAFTLAKGEKIGFQMLIENFKSTKKSYSVTFVTGELHEHAWSEWTEKTPADCTHAKIEQRDCTAADCPSKGHQERTAGEALGHNLTATAAKAATCTEDGNEAYWTCSRCGKLFSDENGTAEITASVVIPAGHSYAFTVEDNADGNGGTVGDKCSVCGAYVNSHEFDNKVEVVGASASPTVALSSGENLMHINRGTVTGTTLSHYASFTADKTGSYTFAFTYITEQYTQFTGRLSVNDNNLASTDYTKIMTGRKVISLTVDLKEGDECKIYLGTLLPSGVNETYYMVNVSCVEPEA